MTANISQQIAIGRYFKNIRDNGLADHIGGFTEWTASVGYTRQHADRLIRFAERVAL